MLDYRTPEARVDYFTALYTLNLDHGIMPGLVYLYMPALKSRFNWDAESALWFAFLNGMTQNPLTSMRMFQQLPQVPTSKSELQTFSDWFNAEWPRLQFDTDRRYGKKETVDAIKSYAKLVYEAGSQEAMLTGKTYDELWDLVSNNYHSFGRLSSFSYLEYVKIMGYGAECTNLLFEDVSGSKSHRNGMLFLTGQDNLVWDKRASNGFDGKYDNFGKMCEWLGKKADAYLKDYKQGCDHKDAGYFTFESQLCQFKNHFFGRRYPGVYSDMAYERIEWYKKNMGTDENVKLFLDIRTALPDWLRLEAKNDGLTIKQRAAYFPNSGFPYRGEHFL